MMPREVREAAREQLAYGPKRSAGISLSDIEVMQDWARSLPGISGAAQD